MSHRPCVCGWSGAAQDILAVVKRLDALEPVEFANQCRETLEAVLLGERDLSADAVGLILETLASVDEVMRTA